MNCEGKVETEISRKEFPVKSVNEKSITSPGARSIPFTKEMFMFNLCPNTSGSKVVDTFHNTPTAISSNEVGSIVPSAEFIETRIFSSLNCTPSRGKRIPAAAGMVTETTSPAATCCSGPKISVRPGAFNEFTANIDSVHPGVQKAVNVGPAFVSESPENVVCFTLLATTLNGEVVVLLKPGSSNKNESYSSRLKLVENVIVSAVASPALAGLNPK